MKSNISIVIPCKDDMEIIESIKSVDYAGVEIAIVFNGSTDEFINTVLAELKKLSIPVTHYVLERPNLALSLEYGTQKAKYDLVLYMDSDCKFKSGALKNFADVAAQHDQANNVFKGEVVFEKGETWIEHIISDSRSHHTAEVLTAYKPPLLISKAIIKKIGGYVFNEKLIWREDSDLDNRIRQAGIGILPVPEGIIYHHKIGLKTDLRSTFRYGIGLAIANVLKIKLTEVPRSTMSAFKSKGFKAALYMAFRNRIYDAGYIYARTKMLFGYYK